MREQLKKQGIMTVTIEVRDLTRRFGEYTAVNGVSFDVEREEVFGLLGPNGAGKSTTIKMLTTLLPPTSGGARVAGYDIVRQKAEVRRSLGYVPQALSADGNLTGYENLYLFTKLYDIPRKLQAARVRDALAFVGLTDVGDKLVQHYSGGMIRRLEVAQALLHEPSVLFLDEPTVGLDPVARQAIWDHLTRLRDETDMTIFLTTHSMEEADRLCTRVGIMHRGDIVALDTPDALKATVGGEHTTLDDVFVHYAGNALETGGNFRETTRSRRTARRLG
jgi:ABC-2 type transport system ATP-binding protein